MSENQSAVTLLRGQFKGAHDWLEGTMGDVTPEQAHTQAGGQTVPIAAHYAHVLMGEDMFVNAMLRGGAPLAASTFADRTGASEMHPMGDWNDWAKRVRLDLPQARQYAAAVYGATDGYLASLTDADLAREADVSAIGMGTMPVGRFLSILLGNANNHCGEISCLKGLQGLKGYPM